MSFIARPLASRIVWGSGLKQAAERPCHGLLKRSREPSHTEKHSKIYTLRHAEFSLTQKHRECLFGLLPKARCFGYRSGGAGHTQVDGGNLFVAPINQLARVSSFLRLKCFALTADTVGFFGIWIGPRARAAVSSVQRLRMAANAGSVAFHVTLRVECRRIEATGNRVFSVDIGLRLMFLPHLFVSPRVCAYLAIYSVAGLGSASHAYEQAFFRRSTTRQKRHHSHRRDIDSKGMHVRQRVHGATARMRCEKCLAKKVQRK